jgi:predicted Rossmann fold nucleotide-binding protein DprA/Smf involved in DNA uptake
VNHGLVLSQFEPGAKVNPGNFPKRNDLMATISDLTIIVEATEKSGTKHQAKSAMRMSKPIGILSSLAEKKLPWVDEILQYRLGFVIANIDDVEEQLDRVLSKIMSHKKEATSMVPKLESLPLSIASTLAETSISYSSEAAIFPPPVKRHNFFRRMLAWICKTLRFFD